MREIKFRAWSATRKELTYNPSIGEGDLNEELKMGWGNGLMQYTGLLDKSGKEIYEGDVIGYWHKASWIVTWTNHQWRLSGGEGWNGSFAFSPSALKGKEIIGNIYENPELIK